MVLRADDMGCQLNLIAVLNESYETAKKYR